jgi:hypothetical protein
MTLKEKFENILHNWIEKDYNRQNVANELQINADKFAIGFGKWVSHNDWVYLPSKDYWVNEEQEELEQKLTSQQLLEIYKKEKGL